MIYEAAEWEHKQDMLHQMFDPEMVSKAYRTVNRYLTKMKKPTHEIRMLEPKIIKDLPIKREPTGNVCVCGNVLDADCHSKCKHCGFQNS